MIAPANVARTIEILAAELAGRFDWRDCQIRKRDLHLIWTAHSTP